MILKVNKNGLFSKEQANRSGLAIYDFTKEDNIEIPFDFCTYSQLQLLGITLNDGQRKLIKGFVHLEGYRGYAALYSFKEIKELI